jgi:hypothetical protein
MPFYTRLPMRQYGCSKITVRVLAQPVRGGDDVLDLGAVLGLQQRDRVDEHRLIGNQLGGLLQFRQGGAGLDARLQHGTAFEIALRRERSQSVVRLIRQPPGSRAIRVARTRHGDTAYTFPMFDEFMKRIIPDADWRRA